MDRGKYDFFTCTNANLSLPHIEREKHNMTTYFSLMSVNQRNLFSWFFSLRNNSLLIMRGDKIRPLISKILHISDHCAHLALFPPIVAEG